jgi:putative FmdB family regulatory protein
MVKKMPLYEYECQKCRKVFTLVLSLREHDEEPVVCPECGSKEVNQLMSSFIAKTESKT